MGSEMCIRDRCCTSLKIIPFDEHDKSEKKEKESKAISEVLNKHFSKHKKSSFFAESRVKEKIFIGPEFNIVKEEIEAGNLDTPSVAEILLKIKEYPLSYPRNRAGITCLVPHPSPNDISECKQPCQFMCGNNCVNTKYVCCESCRLCTVSYTHLTLPTIYSV